MTARWDDLPDAAKVGAPRVRRPARRGSFRCGGAGGCGGSFVDVTYASMERHADEHGGCRIEIVHDQEGDE